MIEAPVERAALNAGVDIITSFEVIEHLFSPRAFVERCSAVLRPGGLIMLTCPNVRGFDVELLGEASATVDAEHLNYLHPASLGALLERAASRSWRRSARATGRRAGAQAGDRRRALAGEAAVPTTRATGRMGSPRRRLPGLPGRPRSLLEHVARCPTRPKLGRMADTFGQDTASIPFWEAEAARYHEHVGRARRLPPRAPAHGDPPARAGSAAGGRPRHRLRMRRWRLFAEARSRRLHRGGARPRRRDDRPRA